MFLCTLCEREVKVLKIIINKVASKFSEDYRKDACIVLHVCEDCFNIIRNKCNLIELTSEK